MSDSKATKKYFVHRYSEMIEAKPGQYYQDYLGIAGTFENLDEAIAYAKRMYNTTDDCIFKVKDDDCYYDNGKNKVLYYNGQEYANFY